MNFKNPLAVAQRARQKGFTLLEVIVSIAVIAGLFMLYTAAINNVFLSRTIKQKDVALRIASHKMEELRAGGYDSLPASGSFSDSNLSSLPSGTGSMTISDYNTSTKQVQVTVSFEDFAGNNQSVSLSTLIIQSGGLK